MSMIPSVPESFRNPINETSLNLDEIQREINSRRDPRPSLEVEYVSPRTSTERKLAEIWAELLHMEKVGINDDFYQLGGHSLLAIEVITRVNQEFSVDVAMETLFNAESNTLAEFARIIEMHFLQKVNNEELESALQEVSQLSDDEVRRLLAEMEKQS